MEELLLNEHHKEEFPPAHTAEHLLNQTMIRLFGCERSFNAHIERKKSKMSFHLDRKPSRQDEKMIEQRMNELLSGGTTLLFVSHSIEQVKRMCQKAIWIDHGEMKMIGNAEEVCNAYSNN